MNDLDFSGKREAHTQQKYKQMQGRGAHLVGERERQKRKDK